MSADTMQQPPPSSAYPGTPPQQHSSLFASNNLTSQSPARQYSNQQQQQHSNGGQPQTPLSHPSPANVASPQIKISPETLASLSGVASPFSQSNSIDSPISSTFSGHNLGLSGDGTGNGGYARAASLALANVVSGGGGGGSAQNQHSSSKAMTGGMEVDLSYANYLQAAAPPSANFASQSVPPHPSYFYPPPSNSAPSSTAPTPNNLAPNSTPSLAAHPPPSHPTVQRHHPYAHASRPSLSSAHSSQNSAVPLYISTTPASLSSTPPPPTSASLADQQQQQQQSIGLGIPPASHIPQRVHSAPAHILSLSTTGMDAFSGSSLQSGDSDAQGARDQRMMLGGESQQKQAQEAALKMLMDAHAAAGGIANQQQQQGGGGGGGGQVGNGGPTSSATNGPGLGPPFLSIEIPPTNQASSHPPPPSAPPILTTTEEFPEDYNDAVSSAIVLLQKRLPIMEAALTTSVVESGQDEEEIWKGIEAAYGDLKRIMGGRKDRRRQSAVLASKVSPSKARGRAFSRMDLESPTTAYPSSSPFSPPPLMHSHSTPNIPVTSQANAARQAAIVQAQRAQQIQYEAQLQAQVQIQAETDRARADEEIRVKQEAAEVEAQARAEAEQEQAMLREQQAAAEHYQQLLHEESLRLARERLHQQMQEGAVGPNPNLPNPPQPLPPPGPTSSAFAQPPYQPPPSQNTAPPPAPAPSQQQQQQQQQQQSTPSSSTQNLPPNAYSNPFDPSATDLAMLQQMSLPDLSYTPNSNNLALPPDSIDPSALSGGPSQTPQNSTSSGSPVTSNTPGSVAGSSGPIRPTRSRAASQSGSRSRAASGSGYQSLLESRSRAASSASSIFHPFERDEEDELDDFDRQMGGAGGAGEIEIDPDHLGSGNFGSMGSRGGMASQMGAATAGVDPESKAKMDPIFLEFLADICSNLDATDLKGEPIHQTLMAKKMEKLDQSHDFRPFKFRIQAFTTAFSERLAASGQFGSDVPIKKIRQYLWAQPFISRFNDDGKKAKSKGNHIWTVEAKKMPDKRWMFREFVRCIKGPAPAVAFVGLNWSWAPRVWDPQCSSSAIDASFMSPTLPPWLSWEDNVLSGEVPESAHGQSFDIEGVATFQMGDKVHQLRAMTSFVVASPNETEDPAALSHAVTLHAAMIKAQEMRGDDDYRTSTNDGSQDVSPAGSALPLYRSPSLGSSGVFENQQQQQPVLVMPGDDFSGSEFTTPAPLDSVFAHQLHQQQQMYSNEGEVAQVHMQVDDSMNSLQAQAALHQHYSNLALQNTPFHAIPASSLSYPPPAELVSNALEDAASNGVNPAYTMSGALLSHPSTDGTGTPNTVFHLRDMGQQPPFTTLDPSQM
ncbi:hypothetical protein JCM16303_002336 [Sporobolomyces ruberrimus]